jgi:GNAT superfamily N-acetyltransferase
VAAGLTLREATLDDVEVMAHTVRIGFEGYRSFAPPGWEPVSETHDAQRMRETLSRADVWALLAFDGAEPAGHVALSADVEPGTAYLWQLFVRPEHWGTGLATTLHGAWLAAAVAQGYVRGRLRTPAGQARARGFYERHGWVPDGEPAFAEELGMELMVYRRAWLT